MIQRSDVVSTLVNGFMADYNTAMKHYTKKEQLEFTNYLLHVVMTYILREQVRRADSIKKGWETLRKKHGRKFQAYENAQLPTYFQFDRVLLEKGISVSGELNDPKDEGIKTWHQTVFLKDVRNHLQRCLEELKFELKILRPLEQPQRAIYRKSKKGITERRLTDTLTCLDKRQTALLIHYLQKKEALLQNGLLNNTRAAEAFEMLTGYNKSTLSLHLGARQTQQNKNKENLKQLSELFSDLKKEVDEELKSYRAKKK